MGLDRGTKKITMPARDAKAEAFRRWGLRGDIWYSGDRSGKCYFVGRYATLQNDGREVFIIEGKGHSWADAFAAVNGSRS